MSLNRGPRIVALVLAVLLAVAQPAWTLCPHADGEAPGAAAAAHEHDTVPGPSSSSDRAAPDCPLGARSLDCGSALSATVAARVRPASPDPALEPDWIVVARTDLPHATPIFRPPIG